MVLAGTDGLTATTCGDVAMRLTGEKFFTGSYGRLVFVTEATAKSLVETSSV